MSYDLNILCVNQESPSKIPFEVSIEIRDEINFPTSGRYFSIWPFLSKTKGIMYSLGIDVGYDFNALSVVDTDFDNAIDKLSVPYWLLGDEDGEEASSIMTPLIVLDEYIKDFENIFEFFINESPSKTIMFLARYQGGDKEVIQGVMGYTYFKKLLSDSKIYFNTCYIIRA